jgi:hypothetical protein
MYGNGWDLVKKSMLNYKLGLGLTKASSKNEKWGGHDPTKSKKRGAGPKISVKKVNKW